MTQTSNPSAHLRWRRPGWAFAALFVLIATLIAWLFGSWAANGFGARFLSALPAMLAPALLGALVLVLTFAARVGAGRVRAYWPAIAQCAASFAIAGFVWPLSFAVQIVLMGDVAAALGFGVHAAMGALIGGIAGALGGALALICLRYDEG